MPPSSRTCVCGSKTGQPLAECQSRISLSRALDPGHSNASEAKPARPWKLTTSRCCSSSLGAKWPSTRFTSSTARAGSSTACRYVVALSFFSACNVVWFQPNSNMGRLLTSRGARSPPRSCASRSTGPRDVGAHWTSTTWPSVRRPRYLAGNGAWKTEMALATTAGALATSSANSAAAVSVGKLQRASAQGCARASGSVTSVMMPLVP
mmetsp:Transcript_17607/g.55751  ORF Transcript_17607/g.55751 Transcript_17607/m.55751 type:complete len:208 (+) Transcript_17607:1161-1784(+)